MPAHVKYAKRAFNMLTLLTKNVTYFSLVSLFINRNFSLRIQTDDIISPQ